MLALRPAGIKAQSRAACEVPRRRNRPKSNAAGNHFHRAGSSDFGIRFRLPISVDRGAPISASDFGIRFRHPISASDFGWSKGKRNDLGGRTDSDDLWAWAPGRAAVRWPLVTAESRRPDVDS